MHLLKPHECFKNNPNLKRAGIVTNYTEEDIKEIIRCKEDIIYFIEKYVKIISLDEGMVNFNLYPFQRTMMQAYKDNKQVICLTCRQAGKCVGGYTKIKVMSPEGKIDQISIGEFYYGSLLRDQEGKIGFGGDGESSGIMSLLPEILRGGEVGSGRRGEENDLERGLVKNPLRKFTGSIRTPGWKIWGPSGWVPLKYLHRTIPYKVWQIILGNGDVLECADNHLITLSSGVDVWCSDLRPGMQAIGEFGDVSIVSIEEKQYSVEMFDPEILGGSDPHYFSSGISSHNTTTAAAYFLYEIVFNTDVTAAILANKAATAREILDRLKVMYENLPPFLQPGVRVWNKGSIELGNNCKVISAATSSSSIRGLSIAILMLDEFAHIRNDVEFFTSTYPVISSGKKSKVIITSTPNGMNLFHKLWNEAVEEINDFKPIKFTWRDHPNRDEEWRRKTLKIMGAEAFAQEHEGEFIGSSGTLITGHKLKQLTYSTEFTEKVNYREYVRPSKEGIYVATVDVSEGTGNDYSVCTVIDVTKQPFEVAAIYRCNTIAPDALPEMIIPMLENYHDPLCVVETNSVGVMVANSLFHEYDYENLLMTETKQGDMKPSSKAKANIGIRQTKQTKRIGCARLKQLIESDSLIINDYDLLQELYGFSRKNNSYEAENGKTDDIVMTLVIFGWLVEQDIFMEITSDNIRKILRKSYIDTNSIEALDFGFCVDGTEEDYENDLALSLSSTSLSPSVDIFSSVEF